MGSPDAHAADRGAPAEAQATIQFFNVGTCKLVVMTVATFGLYEILWLYKHWSAEARSGAEVKPLVRAVMAPFFIHALALSVNERAAALNVPPALKPWPLVIAVLISTAAVRLPEPYGLIAVTSGLVLVPIQRQVARIHSAQGIPKGKEAHFTGLNIAFLAFSAVVWALYLSAPFLPDAG